MINPLGQVGALCEWIWSPLPFSFEKAEERNVINLFCSLSKLSCRAFHAAIAVNFVALYSRESLPVKHVAIQFIPLILKCSACMVKYSFIASLAFYGVVLLIRSRNWLVGPKLAVVPKVQIAVVGGHLGETKRSPLHEAEHKLPETYSEDDEPEPHGGPGYSPSITPSPSEEHLSLSSSFQMEGVPSKK